jgi:hypothetical protein
LRGNYKKNGEGWREKDYPVKVNSHDIPFPNIPKAISCGVYDIGRSTGFENLGNNLCTSTLFLIQYIDGGLTMAVNFIIILNML